MKETIGIIAVIAFFVLVIAYSCGEMTKCEAKGGEYVKKMNGTYTCMYEKEDR